MNNFLHVYHCILLICTLSSLSCFLLAGPLPSHHIYMYVSIIRYKLICIIKSIFSDERKQGIQVV